MCGTGWKGLPGCYSTPLGVHVAQIVWLWGLVKAFGLHEYAKTQYSKLEAQLPLWDKALSKEENWLKVRQVALISCTHACVV